MNVKKLVLFSVLMLLVTVALVGLYYLLSIQVRVIESPSDAEQVQVQEEVRMLPDPTVDREGFVTQQKETLRQIAVPIEPQEQEQFRDQQLSALQRMQQGGAQVIIEQDEGPAIDE